MTARCWKECALVAANNVVVLVGIIEPKPWPVWGRRAASPAKLKINSKNSEELLTQKARGCYKARVDMKKLLLLALISCLSEGALTLNAQDTNIAGLFNTGQGQPAAGEPALHYALVSSPNGATNVFVASAVPGAWNTAGFPGALWISPMTDGNLGAEVGTFNYRLTFLMENASSQALDPSTAHIQGFWGVDNFGTLKLNGNTITTAGSLVDPFDQSGFNNPNAFDITTGFVSGLNTLDFVLENLTAFPNPSGLIVQFTSGTAQVVVVPEPSTLALSAAGVALLGFWRCRKNQA